MITATRRETLMALVCRELNRRPWIETERMGTLTLLVRFDRRGQPDTCLVRTESETGARDV